MFTELNISPVKRACIEWPSQLPGGRQLGNHRSQLLGREVGILSLGAPGGSRGRTAFFRRFWGGGREGGYRGRRRPRRRQPRCEALRWTLRQRELRVRKREQRQRNVG